MIVYLACVFITLKLNVFGVVSPVPMTSGICEPDIVPSVYSSTAVIGQVVIWLTIPESSNAKSFISEISLTNKSVEGESII